MSFGVIGLLLLAALGGCGGEIDQLLLLDAGPDPGLDQIHPDSSLKTVSQRYRIPDFGAPPDGQVSGADTFSNPCAAGERHFQGHCYRTLGFKFITFEVAKGICAGQTPPMQMATISSEEENAFVFGILPFQNQITWIGLKRGTSGGSFSWVSGESLTYANWAKGEPNNETGKEDCGSIWGPGLYKFPDLQGGWNDSPCNSNVDNVVCERAL